MGFERLARNFENDLIFMSRHATTIAKKHTGEWVLLHGPDVPVAAQLQEFRNLKKTETNEEFEIVQYQERDGAALRFTLPTKAQLADRTQAEAKARKEHAAFIKSLGKTRDSVSAQTEKLAKAEHEKVVAEHSKNIERILKDQELSPDQVKTAVETAKLKPKPTETKPEPVEEKA